LKLTAFNYLERSRVLANRGNGTIATFDKDFGELGKGYKLPKTLS